MSKLTEQDERTKARPFMVIRCIGRSEFQIEMDDVPRKGDHVFVGGGRYEVCQVQYRLDSRPIIHVICGGNIEQGESQD